MATYFVFDGSGDDFLVNPDFGFARGAPFIIAANTMLIRYLDGRAAVDLIGADFLLGNAEPVSGTLTRIRAVSADNVTTSELFDFSIPATRFINEVNLGDDRALLASLLAGDDDISGDAGADALAGYDGNDIMNGDGGNDTLIGGAGVNGIDGGEGVDTAVFGGSRAEFHALRLTGGEVEGMLLVADRRFAADIFSGSINLMSSVERLRFDDGEITPPAATFSPLSYLAANPDLAAAFGTSIAGAIVHFLLYAEAEGRPTTFDALGYLAANPDLAAAFDTDVGAAATHFIHHGRLEGRATTFDALGYLAANPDLAAAFDTDVEAAATHFIRFGRLEDRPAFFDGLGYLAANDDLAAAFGFDAGAATLHYIRHGRLEGRVVAFDALDYIATHPDLIAAFGTDEGGAVLHWLTSGRAEGRARDGFDEAQYLLNNPDVAEAGVDPALHFVQHGFAEGRSDDLIG